MDVTARQLELDNQLAVLQEYLKHPVTVEVLKDLHEGQEALVRTICDQPITNLESFFNHFEAVGHLRGLRRSESLVMTNLEEVKEQIRNVENE